MSPLLTVRGFLFKVYLLNFLNFNPMMRFLPPAVACCLILLSLACNQQPHESYPVPDLDHIVETEAETIPATPKSRTELEKQAAKTDSVTPVQDTGHMVADNKTKPIPQYKPVKEGSPKGLGNKVDGDSPLSTVFVDVDKDLIKYVHVCKNCGTEQELLAAIEKELIAQFKDAKKLYPVSIADDFESGTSQEFSSRPNELMAEVKVYAMPGADTPPFSFKRFEVGLAKNGDYYCRER